MLMADLEAARNQWLDETPSAEQRAKRDRSDFLSYRDASGRVADWVDNAHRFASVNLLRGEILRQRLPAGR
jgi:hypothetical protein